MPDPTPLNDVMSDALIRHDVSLLRFDAKLRRQVLGELRIMQDGIVAQLSNVDFSNIAQRARLEGLLEQVDGLIKGTYSNVNRNMLAEMKDLASFEQSFQTAKMNDLFKVDIFSASLTPQVLRAIAKDSSIFGAPAVEWWGRQSAAMRGRFADQMRQGFLLGESTGDLVRRVRGSATGARRIVEIGGVSKSVATFSGGIMDVTTREAEALVRTGVQSVANEVRLKTYLENTDVVGSVQAQVTLDRRTSDICQSHGALPDEWTLPDFEPVGGSNNFVGPPPWHFNCRSSLNPVTKSWEQLQEQGSGGRGTRRQRSIARKLDNNAPKRTRASMNGQVPRDTGYNDWLRTQSKSVQIEVLGPGKQELWKAGKLNLSQTLDQTGRPLTLFQIGQLPANKPLPLKLPPRAPPLLTIPRKLPTAKPEAFIAPPTGVRAVTVAELPALEVGTVYEFNGEVFRVIKKTRTQMESVHFSTRTGKFVSARNKTVLKFGTTPPPTPPVKPKPPTTPTTTTTGAPKAAIVSPDNYRTLNVGSVFKDVQGDIWKVHVITKRGIKVVPWSIKSNRFLAPRNGRTFGFTSEAAPTVKKFTASTDSGKVSVRKLFDPDKLGAGSRNPFTARQKNALRSATDTMGQNGFNKALAEMLDRNGLQARIFNMGKLGKLTDPFGSLYGGRVGGAYWNNMRALGIVDMNNIQHSLHIWIHEFGHHMDYSLFRTNTKLFFGKKLNKVARDLQSELNNAYLAMKKEYKAASNTIGKKLGLVGGKREMTFAQVKNNMGPINRNMKGLSQSYYSLANEKEWFAETFAHFFNSQGSRRLMKEMQPATYNFFQTLFSKEMEVLWSQL